MEKDKNRILDREALLLDYIRKIVSEKLFFIKDIDDILKNLNWSKMKNQNETMKNTIFKLIELDYRADDNPQYPAFDVFSNTTCYFSSLEKAEQAMNLKKQVKSKNPECRFYCFLIKEYKLDEEWETTSDHTPETIQNSGELLEPPAEKMRFQKGDLVEVLDGDPVTLEIVTDDYHPLSHDEKQWPPTANCTLTPSFPVSYETRRELWKSHLLSYIKKYTNQKIHFFKEFDDFMKIIYPEK